MNVSPRPNSVMQAAVFHGQERITIERVEMPEVARDQGYIASACLDLMGEIKAEGRGSPRFLRGITEYPLIGDPVVAVGSDELRVVYGTDGDDTINVGRLLKR